MTSDADPRPLRPDSPPLEERLGAYVDGELDARARAELESELLTDPELVARLERLKELDSGLRELYADEREAAGEVSADRFAARGRSRPWARLPWLLLPFAAAAGLLLGLSLGRSGSRAPKGTLSAEGAPADPAYAAVATLATGPFLVEDGALPAREGRAGEFLPPGTRVSAPAGVRLALMLADGSELRIDRGSSLTLTGSRRLELAGGRVWSRVVPGAPFRITCGAAEVEVHGTELEVARAGEDASLQLFQGSAELRAGGAARLLAAGEQARWRDGALSEVERIESEAIATGWMLELHAYSGANHKDLADHLDRLLAELGRRKLVTFEEGELQQELSSLCRVPIARYLVSASAASEPEARRKAARVLERIADESVAWPLAEALRDPDPEVRYSSAKALRRLSDGAHCSQPDLALEAATGPWIEEVREWARARRARW